MGPIGGKSMECITSRQWLYRKLDGELSESELLLLDLHLAKCPACAREYRILQLPQLVSRAVPVLEPQPFFYSRLRARLNDEEQGVTLWQIILGLSRQVIPALAAITLVVLSLFAYLEMRDPRSDVISAYDWIFTSGDREQRMLTADRNEITDESILLSISEPDGHSETRKK
jgi:hypothetical protein